MNERVSRLLTQKDTRDVAVRVKSLAEQRKAEDSIKASNDSKDVTVYAVPDGPYRTPTPRAKKKEEPTSEPVAEVPRMKKAAVILPEGLGVIPRLVEQRFRSAWVTMVYRLFPGETRQPSLKDYQEWRASDKATANEPAPLAKLITSVEWTPDTAYNEPYRSEPAPSAQRGGFQRPGGGTP